MASAVFSHELGLLAKSGCLCPLLRFFGDHASPQSSTPDAAIKPPNIIFTPSAIYAFSVIIVEPKAALITPDSLMSARMPVCHRITKAYVYNGLYRFEAWVTATLLGLLVAGCATAPLDQAGSLRSYDNLKPSDGLLTRSLLRVSKDDVLAAKTVKIIPTAFSEPAARTPFTPAQRNLVTNAVDRTLCAGLSERFEVVAGSEPADLTVHAVVTHVVPTDAVAAGLSKGASVAKTILLPGVPVPVPRIPVGLGSLSLEAEARDPEGNQKGAMIWGRGANAFLGSGRIAEEGDAYTLAVAFGADFSKLLVKGETPFGGLPKLPSFNEIGALLSDTPKYPACKAFGKSPGFVGMVGEGLGLPPSWTDNGAAVSRD